MVDTLGGRMFLASVGSVSGIRQFSNLADWLALCPVGGDGTGGCAGGIGRCHTSCRAARPQAAASSGDLRLPLLADRGLVPLKPLGVAEGRRAARYAFPMEKTPPLRGSGGGSECEDRIVAAEAERIAEDDAAGLLGQRPGRAGDDVESEAVGGVMVADGRRDELVVEGQRA